MTKNTSHISSRIVCPKCGTKTMRKSVGKGPEYFDDICHSYFTIEELVNVWGYDSGDFIPDLGTEYLFSNSPHIKPWITIDYTKMEEKIIATTWFDGIDAVSVIDEPQWKSTKERMEAYYEVTLMQMGIPSWSLEDYSVDTGGTHV
jgi:hypothetical protein